MILARVYMSLLLQMSELALSLSSCIRDTLDGEVIPLELGEDIVVDTL